MIKCNRKRTFYSTFKPGVTTFNSLEHITNQKHRRAVAKLRAGNYNLRIETGRCLHSTPKLPEHLRICQYCSSNEVHFLFSCNRYETINTKWSNNKTCEDLLYIYRYETIRKYLVQDIIRKYPNFDSLYAHNKNFFPFNSNDACICTEKIRSLHLRSFYIKKWIIRYKNCKLTAFATLYFFSSFFCFCFYVQYHL